MSKAGRWIGPALLLALGVSTPALAGLGGAPDDSVSLWRVFGALIFCLLLAVAGAFAIRARLGGRPLITRLRTGTSVLELEESLRVTAQLQVAIIRCDGARILVAATPSGTPALLPLDEKRTA